MGHRPKVAKAKECKSKVYEQVEKYIDRNAKSNTGQLKFFHGLLIGNLAVTIGKRIRKDKQFQDYLNKEILYDNDEVISFFDREKNLAEFINAPCWDMPELYHDLRPQCDLPPYLLIQKAQNVMENKFIEYIRYPLEDVNTKVWEKKNDAYLDLLFGIAFYEICLSEYGKKVFAMQQLEKNRGILDFEKTIGERFPGVFSDDTERKLEDKRKLLEEIQKEYDRVREWVMVSDYWIMHVTNLYAMLRVIFLVEYVKVSLAKYPESKRNKDEGAVVEANFWLNQAEKWKDCYLFTNMDVTHHLMVNGNKLSQIYRENAISPRIEPDGYVTEFSKKFFSAEEDMQKYIEAIKAHKIHAEPSDSGRKLWEVTAGFAAPVMCVAKKIMKIKEHSS